MDTALAVLDMQKGMFGTSNCAEMLPRLITGVNRALAAARELGWLIVEIRTEWARQTEPLSSRAASDVAFAEPVDGLEFPNGAEVVIKPRHSAFLWTNLETRLRRKQVGRLLLGGVWLDGSVGQTAIDGYERDFETVVLTDAVASTGNARDQLTHSWTRHLGDIRYMSLGEAIAQNRVSTAC